jgi:hypothetical protein
VRLHALQSVHKHSPALEVNRTLLRDQRTLNLTPGPEQVLHAAPRRLGVGAEVAGAVPARRETRRGLGESDVDDTALVHTALDPVRLAVVGDLHGALLGGEVLLVVGEGEVVEVVGGPELGGIGDGVDDFGVELRGSADTEHVAEDDLDEAQLAAVGRHVEGLGLHVGRVHDLPAEVFPGELGEGHILGLLLDGLDGFGAVLALGNADAEEVWLLVREEESEVRWCKGAWRGLVGGVCPVRSKGRPGVAHAAAEGDGSGTYAFFAQLNMISGVVRGVIERDVIS